MLEEHGKIIAWLHLLSCKSAPKGVSGPGSPLALELKPWGGSWGRTGWKKQLPKTLQLLCEHQGTPLFLCPHRDLKVHYHGYFKWYQNKKNHNANGLTIWLVYKVHIYVLIYLSYLNALVQMLSGLWGCGECRTVVPLVQPLSVSLARVDRRLNRRLNATRHSMSIFDRKQPAVCTFFDKCWTVLKWQT